MKGPKNLARLEPSVRRRKQGRKGSDGQQQLCLESQRRGIGVIWGYTARGSATTQSHTTTSSMEERMTYRTRRGQRQSPAWRRRWVTDKGENHENVVDFKHAPSPRKNISHGTIERSDRFDGTAKSSGWKPTTDLCRSIPHCSPSPILKHHHSV